MDEKERERQEKKKKQEEQDKRLIKTFAPKVPALRGRPWRIEPLGGGLTNRNYLLRDGADRYVVRIFGGGAVLGINRDREVAILQAMAAAGAGPRVIQYLEEHSALVMGFCPGQTLENEDFAAPELIARVAALVRRCHDWPPPAGLALFCPFAVVRDYHDKAQQNVVLPDDLKAALKILHTIEEELKNNAEPACLCHNDLLAANFIDDGAVIRLIDWEYGNLGDRFFDLGNLAVNTHLNAAQEETLLTSYFGDARPEHVRRLRLMRLASDMREATWSFLQAGNENAPGQSQDYMDRGHKHLNRFLEASRAIVNERRQA